MVKKQLIQHYPVTYWDSLALEWDGVVANPRNPHQFYYREADILITRLLARPMAVLELACGTGGSTEVHHREVRRLVATDFSWDMIRRARRRFRNSGSRLHFARCASDMLPFRNSSFDAVISRGVVISYVPRSRSLLVEARRVLRRGGRLALDAMNRLDPSDGPISRGFSMVAGSPAYVELSVEGSRQVRRVLFLSPKSRYAALARRNTTCRSKPKGISQFVVGSTSFEARLFEPRELQSLVERAGFREVQIIPLGHSVRLLYHKDAVSEFASKHPEILSEVALALSPHLRPETALHLMAIAKRA